MKDYQQRVIDEKAALDGNIERLGTFLRSDSDNSVHLHEDERFRMARQHTVMNEYSLILRERIANFGEECANCYHSAASNCAFDPEGNWPSGFVYTPKCAGKIDGFAKNFKVSIGEPGLLQSWQNDFPATTKCVHCSGESRHGFTIKEGYSGILGDGHVCDLHKNGGEGNFWLHDCCAVAVYFCKDCLKPSALYNQA